MISAINRVWILDVSSSPTARAGVEALLSSDDSVRLWRAPQRTDAFNTYTSDSRYSSAQPPVPDVIVAIMATDARALEDTLTTWSDAGLVMLGGDTSLVYSLSPARPLAILSLETEAAPLSAAVHAVASGLTVTEPGLLDAERGILGGLARTGTPDASDVLTPREHEVLELVAAGLPNKTIANELGISEHTAKFHVGSLLTKLGAASRTEAVTVAARRGILII